jgi:DNA-binding beta-propeller fold protein YncE
VANTVGKPINTSPVDYPRTMAITPDGKTLYITGRDGLIPFDTASQTVGKPIMRSGPAGAVAIAP